MKEQADVRVWCCNKAHLDSRRRDRDINGGMIDSSKTYLELCARRAFGYGYAVDPQEYTGPMVEKFEHHSHPSQVVYGRRLPRQGRFYSELLHGNEWRIAVFSTLYQKHIPLFTLICTYTERDKDADGLGLPRRINQSSRYGVPLSEVMSKTEVEKLMVLCGYLGLDYGEFDVIRHEDGRLCPIDVNPSPSPPSPHSFTPQDFARIIPEEAELFARTFL